MNIDFSFLLEPKYDLETPAECSLIRRQRGLWDDGGELDAYRRDPDFIGSLCGCFNEPRFTKRQAQADPGGRPVGLLHTGFNLLALTTNFLLLFFFFYIRGEHVWVKHNLV